MNRWISMTASKLAPLAAIATFTTLALAGDWHIVGGDAYKNSDGEWVVWLSDGEGSHLTVKGKTKRKARDAGEATADALNAQGCVDPCMLNRPSCLPEMSASGEEIDWEVVLVEQVPSGAFTEWAENDVGNRVGFTRATAAAATLEAEEAAGSLNAGQCTAL